MSQFEEQIRKILLFFGCKISKIASCHISNTAVDYSTQPWNQAFNVEYRNKAYTIIMWPSGRDGETNDFFVLGPDNEVAEILSEQLENEDSSWEE